jgi:MFS family permease
MIGGIMSAKFGPKYVRLYCIFASSLLSLLSPVAARTHVAVFMAVRVFLGFTQVLTVHLFFTS